MGCKTEGSEFQSRQGKIFLFSTQFTPVLGPTQPPIQWVPGALSSGVMRARPEDDHSPPTNAEVKKTWLYTSTLHVPYWRSAEVVKHRDSLNFTCFYRTCYPFYMFRMRCLWNNNFQGVRFSGVKGPEAAPNAVTKLHPTRDIMTSVSAFDPVRL
jgi:hypothetical protein